MALWSPGRRFLLALVLLLAGIGPPLLFTIPAPSLSLIADHFGGGTRGTTIAQLLMTLPSIGIVAAGPGSGALMRRLPVHRTLILALALFGLFGLAPLFLGDPLILLATRFMAGLAASIAAVATTRLITLFYSVERRARMVSFLAATGAASGVIALLASGAVAARFGWRAPFALYAVGILIAALASLSVPAARHDPADGQSGWRWTGVAPLLPIYLCVVLVFAVTFLSGTQTSFLLAKHGIVSPIVQSAVIGCGALANIIGGLAYPWLLKSGGRSMATACLLGLLGVGAAFLGMGVSAASAAIGCTLMGLGGGMASPHFINLVIDRAQDRASEAVGLCYSSIFVGEFLCPFLMVPFRIWGSLEMGFVACGVGCCVVAGLFVVDTVWRRPSTSGEIYP